MPAYAIVGFAAIVVWCTSFVYCLGEVNQRLSWKLFELMTRKGIA